MVIKAVEHKRAIIEFLTDHVSAKSQEFIDLLGIKITRIKLLLKEMVDEGIKLTKEGTDYVNKNSQQNG